MTRVQPTSRCALYAKLQLARTGAPHYPPKAMTSRDFQTALPIDTGRPKNSPRSLRAYPIQQCTLDALRDSVGDADMHPGAKCITLRYVLEDAMAVLIAPPGNWSNVLPPGTAWFFPASSLPKLADYPAEDLPSLLEALGFDPPTGRDC